MYSQFEIQFFCDKVLVLFTVFEVYSYLLRRLFVNRELLANLVYSYIYIYNNVDRDLLKDTHTDDVKATPYHVSGLVFLFSCPKILQ